MKQELEKTEKKLCEIYELDYEDLRSRNRKDLRADKRYLIYYLLFNNLGMSKNQLAKLMSRDHTTILYGINKAEWILQYDILLRNKTYEAQAYMNELDKSVRNFYRVKKTKKINKTLYKKLIEYHTDKTRSLFLNQLKRRGINGTASKSTGLV